MNKPLIGKEINLQRKLLISLLCFFSVLFACVCSQAKIITAGDLDEECHITANEGNEYLDEFFCFGYLSGYIDAIHRVQHVNESSFDVCLPSQGITIEAAQSLFLGYMHNHPARNEEPANIVLHDILVNQYPCT